MLVNKKFISVKFSETKLKQRQKALAVLFDIGSDLTTSLSLTEILDRAIIKVREHFRIDAVRIYLMDHKNKNLDLVAYKGISKQQVEELRRIPISTGFSGKAARTKSFIAQRVSDLENGERSALLHGKGFRVIICVPLIVKDQVIGVMNLAFKRSISLSESKMDLLVAIGNQIAIAINVAGLYEKIRKKAEEAKKKKDDLEFFAYSVSHDLKNPAVGAAGFAKLLSEKYADKLDAKGRTYCAQIRKAAEQIERFTNDINEYIKTSNVAFNMRKINIKKVLEQIRNEVSPVLKERNITWSEPESLPRIVGDQAALMRVFRNLIDNALKHGGDRLRNIAIGYDHDDRYHIFSLSNDGDIIKKKNSELVFEMFRRLPEAEDREGAGLGLAIVKDIVENHAGKVWCESGPRNRTTFYVAIPKN